MFWIIIVLVFLNTCVLATEHYKQPKWLDYFQDVTNLFFVVLFTCEMLIKMYALGLQVGFMKVTPCLSCDFMQLLVTTILQCHSIWLFHQVFA